MPGGNYKLKKIIISKFVAFSIVILIGTVSIFSNTIKSSENYIDGDLDEENYDPIVAVEEQQKSALMAPPNLEWNMTFGGTYVDLGYSVQQTNDGGYIAAGYTSSFSNGSVDVWLVKTNSDGTEQWNRTYGGSESDRFQDMTVCDDGGYAFSGYTRSFTGVGSTSTSIMTPVII